MDTVTEETEVALKSYEMMFILMANLGEQKTQEALDEVKELITSSGGSITHEDIWGTRELAYTIKKQDHGFYVVLNLDVDPSKIITFNKPLNLNQSIIRYMFMKTPKNYVFTTKDEFETLAEKDEEEQKKKKEESAKKKIVKKSVEKAKKAVKEEEKKEEKVEKVVTKTAEVDEKLKDIINDPDISL